MVFFVEHNRLSAQLKLINPHWIDEKVFQEARKIVIAVHQHITFNEFLPRVLGAKLMSQFGLTLSELYDDGVYDGTCSTVVFNEFATAAFRYSSRKF